MEFNYGRGPPKRRRLNKEGETGFTSSPPVAVTQDVDRRQVDGIVGVEGVDGEDQPAMVGQESGDWQNKEDYEHAQVDETVDIGGMDPAGEGIEQRGDDMEVGAPGGALSKAQKEARKLAKRDKRKKERQEKNKPEKSRRSSG